MASKYRIAVIELDDICPRIEPDLPNLFVGVTSRTPDELSTEQTTSFDRRGLEGMCSNRYDLVPDRCTSLMMRGIAKSSTSKAFAARLHRKSQHRGLQHGRS